MRACIGRGWGRDGVAWKPKPKTRFNSSLDEELADEYKRAQRRKPVLSPKALEAIAKTPKDSVPG